MFQPRSNCVIILAAAVLATLLLGGAGQGVGAQAQSFSQPQQGNSYADPGAAPNAYLGETFHDMGTAKVDETVSYQFVVENKGAGVLRIKDVAPGWGCTVVKFDREIPAGQKGFIKLSIHLTPSFSGRTITKRALVITNDMNNRRFILRLKVAVEDMSSQAAIRPQ